MLKQQVTYKLPLIRVFEVVFNFIKSFILLVIYFTGLAFNKITTDEAKKSLVDMELTTPEMVKRHGYPVEEHKVTTEDGYILCLHRLPRPGSPVVYVNHGVICSSAVWVEAGPEFSLAYSLYDSGFDVWLGNSRGNPYSKQHETLSTSYNNPQYWDFSWHEMGIYDLPAVIDHMLSTTGQSQLNYIGHSMGTTMFWILASLRPEYNIKIRQMHALAPVAYMTESIGSPQLFIRVLKWIASVTYFLSRNLCSTTHADIFNQMGIITTKNILMETAGDNIYNNLFGYSKDEVIRSLVPVFTSHSPSGASNKTVTHFAQLINTGKFTMFNYGNSKLNTQKYGSVHPPEYDVTKVKAPVHLHLGPTDNIARVEDVEKLRKLLPNVKGYYLYGENNFNHMDFLWGRHAKSLVWNNIIKILKQE